jgi:hypothetical protein
MSRHLPEEQVDNPIRYGAWQERANAGSGNFAGAVVPEFFVADFGLSAQPLRPLADAMLSLPLGDHGIAVDIATVSTPTTAGVQASENSAAPSQGAATTVITANVQLAAGTIQVSLIR